MKYNTSILDGIYRDFLLVLCKKNYKKTTNETSQSTDITAKPMCDSLTTYERGVKQFPLSAVFEGFSRHNGYRLLKSKINS